MTTGNSIINFGDISKPATVLIERISDAIGAIYKPRQIIRLAQAEAEANKIKLVSQLELSELQSRALSRIIEAETIKQTNIENITSESLPLISSSAKPEKIEKDWLSYFFEKAQIVSDKEMQTLWSKILAGEANNPGTYSRRTINLIATLDKDEANIFTKFCSFKFNIDYCFPLIYNIENDIIKNSGINYGTLTHLEDLGLIKLETSQAYIFKGLDKIITLNYFEKTIQLEFPNPEKNDFQIGKVIFTKIGQELAPISGASMNNEYFEYIFSEFNQLNIAARVIS